MHRTPLSALKRLNIPFHGIYSYTIDLNTSGLLARLQRALSKMAEVCECLKVLTYKVLAYIGLS